MSTESTISHSITPRQRGAVMHQFARLGLTHPSRRTDRLGIASVLACDRRITSVNELTSGEAGRLLRALSACRDCRDLAARVAGEVVESYGGDSLSP